MEKNFKETHIPEDFSMALESHQLLCGPSHVFKVAKTVFHGISSCLGSMKNVSIPKAIIIRSIDHSFLAGAKVEYIPNKDDKNNPAAGRWDYTWTTFEDDLKGADCIDIASNSIVASCMQASGYELFNMKFNDSATAIYMATLLIEMIIDWVKENTTEVESASLVLDGAFKATGVVENGKVVVGIVPAGEMKVLIKDDNMIQEA